MQSIVSRSFIISLLALALPVAGQMLLQSFLGMVDVMMVSPLGEEAIAAVGLSAKIHFLLLVLMSGFATGGSILIAQYLGANNFSACQRILSVTLVVGFAIIIPIALLFGFAAPLWTHWITPNQQVANLAGQFLMITAPVLLLTQVIVILEASLRALGQTALPLAAGVAAAVVNVVLNYALIMGHWGFPALGVAGAAWATLTARVIQLSVILWWLYSRKHGFALSFSQWLAGANKDSIKPYLAFSLPLVVNYGVWALGNATYHIVTGFAGTDALAVMGMVVPVESTFFALFVGLANASAVLIGRALGGDRLSVAWQIQRFFNQLTWGLLAVMCLGLFLLRPLVIDIFSPLSPATVNLLYETLAIFCSLVVLKVFNLMRIVGVLRAGGDNKFCLITDTLVMWGLGLPIYAIAVFVYHCPFWILYGLMFLEDALKLTPVWIRVHKKKWMKNLTKNTHIEPTIVHA